MPKIYATDYRGPNGEIVYKRHPSREAAVRNAVDLSKRVDAAVYVLAQQDGWQLGERVYSNGAFVREEGRF
jgi:hypothetical protein